MVLVVVVVFVLFVLPYIEIMILQDLVVLHHQRYQKHVFLNLTVYYCTT